jgi:RNA polymerase sigma-70 factor (TIGR02957 family)
MTDLAVAHHELRPLMFPIAYRMLGSVAEAEDIVQEAFLRIHKAVDAGEVLEVPEAYATTVTTRLAIDTLRSARIKRETYPGSWLPEPILDDDTDPAHRLELDDTVSTAFLVVLERLSPVERAVFLLREVFGYGYDEIAEVVQKTEANCRQLLARAKSHLDDERPRFDPSPEHRAELAARFFAALHDGDVKGLERLLADDVMFYADGGGKVPAIAKPLRGVLRVGRFLLGLMRIRARATGRLIPVEANGHPAARLELATGELVGVMMLDIADGRIQAIRNQLNPDKLHHLGQVGDIRALVSTTDTSPPE